MSYKNIYETWLKSSYFDEKSKEELKSIQNDENEIKDRFYKDLEFGTGGLRGIIGLGTNRINKYVVSKVSQGFANYLLNQQNPDKNLAVAISYDTRNKSYEFAKFASLVLNANGIKTYLFKNFAPTPVLSFAVRELNCLGGIMITASHNPPEYNGYKVYGSDGAQLCYPRDEELITFVNNVSDFSHIKSMEEDESLNQGLLNFVGEDLLEKYTQTVVNQMINDDVNRDLKIVYTPLHGTGAFIMDKIFQKAGFSNFNIVSEQKEPDPNFSTAKYPNPEEKNTFDLALKLAKNKDADIVLATDPDADRVGVYVKHNNEYHYLTGNVVGSIIAEYILQQRKEKGILKSNDTIISTIVSTNLTREIANNYGVNYMNVLTGFKYIGEKIKLFEQNKNNNFVFGFEESIGYLTGTYSRDKDGVCASLIICEIASYCKQKGQTLIDFLESIYKNYGFFLENTISITLKGIDGSEKIKKIMHNFRNTKLDSICGLKILELQDYLSGISKVFDTNETYYLTLPKSDVLYFELEDNNWFCIRPSGTEPKVKIYFGVKCDTKEKSKDLLELLQNSVMKIIDEIS